MKCFYILVLFFGVCSCHINQERAHDLSYDIVGSNYQEGKEKIYRPCALNDLDCMRCFLADNSQCTPARGFLPEPLYMLIERFYFPVASMTVTYLDAEVRGLRNATITEFYVNKATGNVVIAINIPKYVFGSHGFFTYARTAKEPIAKYDYTTFEVVNLILTAAIPKVSNLRLDFANIHAYTHNTGPKSYYIGPNAYKSSDPEVKSHFAEFTKNIPTALKEVYVFHSYLLMTTFIQNKLCNFGLDSYRNYNGFALGKCRPQSPK